MPAHFSKAWEQYAEDYCFIQNTYFVKPDQGISTDVETRSKESQIGSVIYIFLAVTHLSVLYSTITVYEYDTVKQVDH